MLATAISIAIPGLSGLYFLAAGVVELVNSWGYCLGPTTKFRFVIGVPENKRANWKWDYVYNADEHGRVIFWLDAPGYLPAAVVELAIATFLLAAAVSNLIFPHF